jgi:uncharacterized protein YndB with AHSA1/START domain
VKPASLALAGLLLASTTTHAAVLDKSPSGFTVENTVLVPVAPVVAWNAFVDQVDEWWPKDHSWWGKDGKFTIDPRAGGCFCEVAGKRSALHMTVSFVDAPHKMRMLGGQGPLQGMGLDGVMEWTFASAEGGTKITLRYVAGGYTTTDLVKFSAIVDKVQGIQLGGLAAYLQKPR